MVPDVPTFAVDAGFWYSLPEPLADRVDVGWKVRVPLSGRRVGGFVVERGVRPPDRLRDVAAVSGVGPIFDLELRDSLLWAADHYVAPVSTLLGRADPPNVPPEAPGPPSGRLPAPGDHPLADVVGTVVGGGRRRPLVWLAPEIDPSWLSGLAAPIVGSGRTVLLVAPTSVEVEAVAAGVRPLMGEHLVVVTSEMDDRDVTSAWATARHHPAMVVGTPRVAAWHVARPGLAVLADDGRRAMKDRQTPTVHARDLLRVRSVREGWTLVIVGPTPSVEAMGLGPEIRRPPGSTRAWPLVEVVDRRAEPPGSGLLSGPARQAIAAVTGRGGRTFVYAHRHGYSAAARCGSCRTPRRCGECGSRPDPGPRCARCGAELGPCTECGADRFEPLGAGVGRLVADVGRVVGEGSVAAAPEEAPVVVGTERDLAGLAPVDLAVLVDLDGLVYGSNYRAAEEALRIGARLAAATGGGSGRRLMVQTSDPAHPVVVSLRRGDPTGFLESELAERERMGYPPAGSVLVLEVRGDAEDPADVDRAVRDAAADALVMGPAPHRDGRRWLVQGPDLDSFRVRLRSLVRRWRDAGATVRIDADPIDL